MADLLQMCCKNVFSHRITVLSWLPVMCHVDKDKQGPLGVVIMNRNKEVAIVHNFSS